MGGDPFTIAGWTGKGTLSGTALETLVDTVAANTTLTNTSLAVTGGPTLTLLGFATANLTDTAGGNTFTVSGWTGMGSLADTGTMGDTITASKSSGYVLSNNGVLVRRRCHGLGLTGFTTANLTDLSTSGGNPGAVTLKVTEKAR